MAQAKEIESEVIEGATDFEDEFAKIAEANEQVALVDPEEEEETTDVDPDAIAASDTEDPDPDPAADPYEGMDEATKARFIVLEESNTKLNHRLDSDSGRVSAFQRQVNDLKRENSTLKAPAAKPTENQIADAMKGTDEGWDQFNEDYPEVAKAIDRRLEMAGKATQESVDSTLAPVMERQAQQDQVAINTTTQAKVDEVAVVYPEWAAAVQTKDFVDWLATQPPGIAALSNSDDTNDASALIGMYDEHLVATNRPSLKATPKPALNQDEVPDGSEAANLAAKRAQQLEDGTTIASRNAKIDAGAEPVGDFESAFAFHAKRKDAKRATA